MKGLLVAAAGDIEMVDKDGNVVLFTIAAGAAPVFIPVQVKRVNATNTTIADASILGIWS